MTTSRILAALVCCVALSACSKDNTIPDISAPAPGAAVKFYNFSQGSPNVNFYANDTKLTGVNSTSGTESTTGTAFGGVAAGGFYTGLTPGQVALSGRITATADNGVSIVNATTTLANKFYSFYLAGAYNTTTKQSDWFIVEDPIPPDLDFANTTVRYVNGMHTSTGPQTLWAKNTVTGDSVAVGGAVAYKSAGAFVTIPSGVYDLTTRYTGSNTAVLTRAGVSFLVGKVYTVSGRAGTGTVLDNTANR